MTPWAQILLVILSIANLCASAAKHGKLTQINFWMSLISFCLINGLLWWGGFWRPLFGG
jgi:hypothetical protein